MEGIPGEVGGALRNERGAMGFETFDNVVRVVISIPKAIRTRRRQPIWKSTIGMSRHCSGITRSPLCFADTCAYRTDPAPASGFAAETANDTAAASSAGCIFKNPGPCPAGKLVDELGLKNLHVGNARVSDVHGNFIVNDGGATADEVLELIAKIKATAREKRGIELETEVQIVGNRRD
jgi:UDP-N-acetylenolpyruvoylglucosamine reductase